MASRATQFRKVEPALVEQRVVPRHFVNVSYVEARGADDRPRPAALHDLSVYGCRLALPVPEHPGTRVSLTVGEQEGVAATVVWSDGGFVGCRFDTPLDRGLVRSLTLVIC